MPLLGRGRGKALVPESQGPGQGAAEPTAPLPHTSPTGPPLPTGPCPSGLPTLRPYYSNWELYKPSLSLGTLDPAYLEKSMRRRREPDWADADVAKPSPFNGPARRYVDWERAGSARNVSVAVSSEAETEPKESSAPEDETPPPRAKPDVFPVPQPPPKEPSPTTACRLPKMPTRRVTSAKTGVEKEPSKKPAEPSLVQPPAPVQTVRQAKAASPPADGQGDRDKPFSFDEYLSPREVEVGLERGQLVQGEVRINQRNWQEAFVDNPDGDSAPDLLVQGLRDRNRALHGDTVALRLKPSSAWVAAEGRSGAQPTGVVVAILHRRHSRTATGTVRPCQGPMASKFALFSPRDSRVPRMLLPLGELPPDFPARPQDFARFIYIASLVKWERRNKLPLGRLVKELGEAGDVEAETEGLLAELDIDDRDFTFECLASLPEVPEGCEWEIPVGERLKRRDFRDELVFTIDPKTARDLDDALHCRHNADGTFEVGVHIADVSYFVGCGTVVDEWAARRATSVYLVHRVIPMLPRLLCERLCSLNPNVERLAFSIVWKMSPEGEVLEEWCGRSVIRSVAKLSYDVAQGFIEEPERRWQRSEVPSLARHVRPEDIVAATLRLNRLAGKLRKGRYERGAIRLDQPKLSFALNEDMTAPLACSVYPIRDSNRLVEEWMLKANTAVAARISDHFPQLAVLRRHPPPKGKLLQDVLRLCAASGYPLEGASSQALAASLLRYAGHSDEAKAVFAVLSSLCLRPMQLARYFCTGEAAVERSDWRHYALAEDRYTHFTSPIRRYPDLMVHRLLAATLDEASGSELTSRDVGTLKGLCKRSNEAKLNAKSASDKSSELFFALFLRRCGAQDETSESGLTSRDVGTLKGLCKRSNEAKLNAKSASDKSSELFFALFLRRCGAQDEEGVVMSVMDYSVDVLVPRLGLVKRVYFRPDPQPFVKSFGFDEGPPAKLTVVWEVPETGVSATRALSIMDRVTVRLAPEAEKPCEYVGILHPPSSVASLADVAAPAGLDDSFASSDF